MVIKSRICAVSGIFVLGLLAAYCFGAAEPRNPQTPDPKVAETATRIQQSLDVILPEVNKGLKPAASPLAGGQRLLDESKRYFLQMDDKQKAQYCLLQSWMAYYGGTMEAAFMSAVKACKLDATNGDAWASQVAMSVLAGKKPMMPRAPKPARAQRNRQNAGGMESLETAPIAAQIQKGKLDFDLNLFLTEAVGKKIGPLQLHCLNGTTLDYQPGNAGLCALLWRKFEAKTAAVNTEPNGTVRPAPQAAPPAVVPMDPMFGSEMMMGAANQSLEGTPEGAFGKLFQAGLASGRIKFAAVNIDSPADKKPVREEMITRPQPWAQVIAADQAEGLLSEFHSVSPGPGRPVLMIADTTGTVRYAGPATGFIAPMLIEGIVSGAAASAGATEEKTETEPVVASVTPADSNSPAVMDSNSLSAGGNPVPQTAPTPAPTTQKPAIQKSAPPQTQYKELSEEDRIQAEKLVIYTEDLFMKAAGKGAITYKRGIDLCRQVMKEYPGTEYAEKARQLLRKVPENQRGKYGITDQELGL